jgi:pimeloyl-ACP methyl ester carboxylesterase
MKMSEMQLKPWFLTPQKVQLAYPLLIYLPGMDGTGQLFRLQTTNLELAFDVRCLAIPSQDLSSWDILTKNVLSLIYAELGKNQERSIYLCGESFGGCLALKVATHAPDLFERIILINPASAFQLSPWVDWISPITDFVPPFFYELGALGLLPFLASLPRMSRSVRHELLKAMRSVPPETISWRLSLLRNFDVDIQHLQKLHQQVLLIAGGSDRLLPSQSEVERLISILPNSKTVLLPDSGHACLLEAAVNLYEIIQAAGYLPSNHLPKCPPFPP